MRKVERFEAHLDDYNSITVYLSKRFYQGKSESFFLREPSGKLTKLVIKSFENTSNEYSKYMLAGCESIEFGISYEVVEEHSLSTPLQIGLIVKSPRFDQEFYYPGNDLGAHIKNDVTEFALWAPTAVAVKVQVDTGVNTMKNCPYSKIKRMLRLLNVPCVTLQWIKNQIILIREHLEDSSKEEH